MDKLYQDFLSMGQQTQQAPVDDYQSFLQVGMGADINDFRLSPEETQARYQRYGWGGDASHFMGNASLHAGGNPIGEGLDYIFHHAPILSSIAGAIDEATVRKARERIAKGKGTDEDYQVITRYNANQEAAGQRSIGGNAFVSAQQIPGMVLEGAIGGAALRGAGIAGPSLLSAGAYTSGRAFAGAAGRNLAQTLAMPGMWAPGATERAAEDGGYSVGGVASSVAMGYINTAVLGSLGGVLNNTAGASIPTIVGRVAARTGLGMLEQQGADILAGTIGLAKDYGLISALKRGMDKGDYTELATHAISQAITFAAFSAMHGSDPKTLLDHFNDARREIIRRGQTEAEADQILALMQRDSMNAKDAPAFLQMLKDLPPDAIAIKRYGALISQLTQGPVDLGVQATEPPPPEEFGPNQGPGAFARQGQPQAPRYGLQKLPSGADAFQRDSSAIPASQIPDAQAFVPEPYTPPEQYGPPIPGAMAFRGQRGQPPVGRLQGKPQEQADAFRQATVQTLSPESISPDATTGYEKGSKETFPQPEAAQGVTESVKKPASEYPWKESWPPELQASIDAAEKAGIPSEVVHQWLETANAYSQPEKKLIEEYKKLSKAQQHILHALDQELVDYNQESPHGNEGGMYGGSTSGVSPIGFIGERTDEFRRPLSYIEKDMKKAGLNVAKVTKGVREYVKASGAKTVAEWEASSYSKNYKDHPLRDEYAKSLLSVAQEAKPNKEAVKWDELLGDYASNEQKADFQKAVESLPYDDISAAGIIDALLNTNLKLTAVERAAIRSRLEGTAQKEAGGKLQADGTLSEGLKSTGKSREKTGLAKLGIDKSFDQFMAKFNELNVETGSSESTGDSKTVKLKALTPSEKASQALKKQADIAYGKKAKPAAANVVNIYDALGTVKAGGSPLKAIEDAFPGISKYIAGGRLNELAELHQRITNEATKSGISPEAFRPSFAIEVPQASGIGQRVQAEGALGGPGLPGGPGAGQGEPATDAGASVSGGRVSPPHLTEQEAKAFLEPRGKDWFYNKLDAEEQAAAGEARGGIFSLNRKLRDSSYIGPGELELVKNIDSAINKGTVDKPITVWREIKLTKKEAIEFLDDVEKTGRSHQLGYQHTTLSRDYNHIAETGGTFVTFEINVPEGSKAGFLYNPTSGFANETEVLLGRGALYKLVSRDGNHLVVDYLGSMPPEEAAKIKTVEPNKKLDASLKIDAAVEKLFHEGFAKEC